MVPEILISDLIVLNGRAQAYLLGNRCGVRLVSEPEATFAGAGRRPSAGNCPFAIAQRDLDRLGHRRLFLLINTSMFDITIIYDLVLGPSSCSSL